MSFFEGRKSDSPYIAMVWRGRSGEHYNPVVCPADENWNLLFTRLQGRVSVQVEGPLTKALPKIQPPNAEWLVIKFTLGTFMPNLAVGKLLDGSGAVLPEVSRQSFWLDERAWQLPDYDNVETFVEWLVRHEVIVRDPVIPIALRDQPQDLSPRTVRRRFLRATGLTQGSIRQIERAKQALRLLEQGVPILDAVDLAGYADQPHLTRSLKHFTGMTPAQIVRAAETQPQF
jgi:AraC-like DNA-binding protein